MKRITLFYFYFYCTRVRRGKNYKFYRINKPENVLQEILRRVFARSVRKSGKILKLWPPPTPPKHTPTPTPTPTHTSFNLIYSLSFFFSILKGALCYKHVLSSFIYAKFGKIVMTIFFLIESYELLKTVKASVLVEHSQLQSSSLLRTTCAAIRVAEDQVTRMVVKEWRPLVN